jgi:subtilase family serine protease
MQQIILQENPNIITSYPDLIQAYRLDTFTNYTQMVGGIAGGELNPYVYFSVRQVTQAAITTSSSTMTPTAAPSSDTWIAIIAIIIAIIAIAYGVTARRRRTASSETK